MLDKQILAYGLAEKRLLSELKMFISPDYFQTEYQVFYKLLLKCFDKFKEVPTPKVMAEQGLNLWTDPMGDLYAEILAMPLDIKEFPSDLEKFKLRYNKQILLSVGKTIFTNNWDGNNFKDLEEANTLFKKTVSDIDSIYRQKVFQEGGLSNTVNDSWNKYKRAKDNPESVRGVHLGFKEFDRITNGLQPSELMLIGGESSAGKSVLAMNMALNAWLGSNKVPENVSDIPDQFSNDGVDVLFFSLEMPFDAIRRRCDACLSGIPLNGIRDGNLTVEEERRFKASLKFQRAYDKHFHIIDIPRSCTMSMIESKYLDVCLDFNPKLIVIDYISLMSAGSDQGSDWLNLGHLAEQMHEFCRTYQISVISPVQLNRPPKGFGKNGFDTPPADQHRVGRSIMLTQNANILLNIESRKDEELKSDMVIRIAKMRDGERMSFILQKQLHMMRLIDQIPGWEDIDAQNVSDGYGDEEN